MNTNTSAMSSLFTFALLSSQSLLAHNKVVKTEDIDVFGGKASASAVLNHQGQMSSLTLTIDMQSIEKAPADEMKSFTIEMPEAVKSQSFIDHLTIDWNPHGHHPAGIYGKPHFDFHFYNPTTEQVMAFDCNISSLVSQDLVATGYVLPPADDPTACVPQMGIHAVPLTDLAPDYDFWSTFIYGYYNNEFIFLEPMIIQQFFLDHKSVDQKIELPAAVQDKFSGRLLPTHYSVTYDAKSNVYNIKFDEFVGR